MKQWFYRAATAVLAALALAAAAFGAPLRKGRATAVILYDVESERQESASTAWDYYGGETVSRDAAPAKGAALATETIRSELLRAGYKMVSDAVTARIVKAQSATSPAPTVSQLSRTYGVTQYIDGSVQVQAAECNDLGMYSGSATVMAHAYDRTGRALFSDAVTASDVGSSPGQAELNAVRKASLRMAERLTGVGSDPDAADGGMYVFVSGARGFRTAQSVLNACKSVYGVTSAKIGHFEGDTAQLAVVGTFSVNELRRAITDKVPYANITETNDHTIYVSIY